MANEGQNYGKKFDYDPLWEGPMKQQRSTTDFKSLIAFIVFVCCLGAISIYAFQCGDLKRLDNSSSTHDFPSSGPSWEKIGSKINESKFIILGFVILGGVLSLAFIVMVRYFPKFVVYVAMIVLCAALLCSAIFGFQSYAKKHDNRTLYSAIASSIGFVVTIILLVCYRKSIRVACEVVRHSSKAFMYFPSSLLFPILPFLFYALAISFFSLSSVHLVAIPKKGENLFAHLYILLLVNVFGLFWVLNFISGFTQMSLSGTFATWYWTLNKNYVPDFTLARSMFTTTRYHLGTISFGSFIISIVEFINFLLRIAESAQRQSGTGGAAAAVLICCCQMFCKCIEDFVRFISRKAYVMCAIHGTSFINSAKDAFNLIQRNLTHTVVVTNVTSAISFLGIVIAFAIPTAISYLYFNKQQDSEATGYLVTSVGVLVLFFALPIFSVLNTAVDTIFLCVLEDYERNDGSVERPHYMSPKLKQLLFH